MLLQKLGYKAIQPFIIVFTPGFVHLLFRYTFCQILSESIQPTAGGFTGAAPPSAMCLMDRTPANAWTRNS